MPKRKSVKLSTVVGVGEGFERKLEFMKDLGFDAVEPQSPKDWTPKKAEATRRMIADAGLEVSSVMGGIGWTKPLTAPTAAARRRNLDGHKNMVDCTKAVGTDSLLVLPGLVTDKAAYDDVYKWGVQAGRSLCAHAEKAGVKCCYELVWSKFCYSPLEFLRFLGDIGSPAAKFYYDMANMVDFGYPLQWLRLLRRYVWRVHFKDFRRSDRSWPLPGEGDAGVEKVAKALGKMGYSKYVTAECGEKPEVLQKVIRKMKELF
jgi:hexulose-6-phosphate isomerase